VNIVAYESSKVVIQGRKTEEFIQFELEPNVMFGATFSHEEIEHPE
jgi:ribonuclease HIII